MTTINTSTYARLNQTPLSAHTPQLRLTAGGNDPSVAGHVPQTRLASDGINPLVQISAIDSARTDRQRNFSSVLARAQSPAKKQTHAEEARSAAEELVARALVQPILAKWRESRDAAPPFGPGEIDKTFGPIMDAELSNRLTKTGHWTLVDRVADRMLGRVPGAVNTPVANSNTNNVDSVSGDPISIETMRTRGVMGLGSIVRNTP